VPLRDDRSGRRATIGSGTAPFRPTFKPLRDAALAPAAAVHDVAANEIGVENAAANDFGPNEFATHGVHTNAVDPAVSSPTAIAANADDRSGGVPVDIESLPPAPMVERQQRSLLEPGAALMAIARPFLAARSAWFHARNLSTQKESRAGESLDDAAVENGVLVERSFANEVASLLRAPLAETAPYDDATRTSTAADDLEPPEAHGSPVVARADSTAAHHSGEPERAADHRTADSQDPISPERISEHRSAGENAHLERPPMPENADSPKNVAQQNIVVATLRQHRGERVVPLTRLPLRPQGFAITWTADLAAFASTGTPSRTQRHGLLERLVREPASVPSDVVARAYDEEDGEGRTIALRVLLRNFPQAGRAAFIEALRVGSDDERAIAVDGLTAIGAREELTPAFADRVDAIAAKAALAYVGTFMRADYAAALSSYVDEARIDAILKLLAGIVE
jgi:hypothetical protein